MNINIHPVILAGGSGTRLWPVSREASPKQFIPLLEGRSPFQATLERIGSLQPARVITNREHRYLVAEQARGRALAKIYLEPCGRSTAPALAFACLDLVRHDPAALVLALPADHDIPDREAFLEAVTTGAEAARRGRLVVFGVEPRWAETGYGYIERGDALEEAAGCFGVESFVEKPELEIATRLATSGRHSWNSGIFLFGAKAYLDELERLAPDLAAGVRAVFDATADEGAACLIDPESFARCASQSIDRAVMEHTELAALVPARFRWSDIGSWDSLWDNVAKDGAGNATRGEVRLHDSSNTYVHAGSRLVVGIDVEDLVVVDTPDALLVAHRGSTQRVREAVEQLKAEGRTEPACHRRVHRPWGFYEDVDAGDRFRVKRITVAPGGKLSLQWHHHRAEHWVVVSGTARVTRGDQVMLLTENQSIYIAVGELHRLENPGKVPLQIIEVQTGAYLGEDDIVRVEDAYQRAPAERTT